MTVAEIADQHQRAVIEQTKRVSLTALRSWHQIDYDNLDTSWVSVGAALSSQTVAGQAKVLSVSNGYISRVADAYDFDGEGDVLVAQALIGVDAKGRTASGALYGAVTTVKEATRTGVGRVQSLQAGANYLAAIVKTLVSDAGRAGDAVAASGKGFTRYVRVVNSGACSRCAMLSGVRSAQTAFSRHPACKCTSCPVPDAGKGVPAGLFGSPDDYFDSLGKGEQDRVFTKSGAQAIRDGASMQSVVSARRKAAGISTAARGGNRPNSGRRLQRTIVGVKPDGTPVMAYTTVEGSTRRGQFGKAHSSTNRVRVMPEEIYNVATTHSEARVLLRDAGYLETPGLSPEQRVQQAVTDRALADRLYRHAGYSLG